MNRIFSWVQFNWQVVAIAFSVGLASGYVGAVWQFQHAVLSHTDKAVVKQQQYDKKQQKAATDTSIDAKERRAAAAPKLKNVIGGLAAQPKTAPSCDLTDTELRLLNEAGK